MHTLIYLGTSCSGLPMGNPGGPLRELSFFYREVGCLFVGGPEFFGVVKGGGPFLSVGQRGGTRIFWGSKRGGGQKFFPKPTGGGGPEVFTYAKGGGPEKIGYNKKMAHPPSKKW